MAVKHLGTAFDVEGIDDAGARHVYLEMAYWADKKGVIRIPQDEVAERCHMSRSSVARAVARLVEGGMLKRVGHGRFALILETDQAGRDKRKFLDWLRSMFPGEELMVSGLFGFSEVTPDIDRQIEAGFDAGVWEFAERPNDDNTYIRLLVAG